LIPKPGDVLEVGRAASVQFAGGARLVFRVISISPQATYEGWAWMTGYVLDSDGVARERREIFVRVAGLCCHKPEERGT
jgi:hypothetical protein